MFFVTVKVRGLSVFPSLQQTNLYPSFGVAEMVMDVPSSYDPPPKTEPCDWSQLRVMVCFFVDCLANSAVSDMFFVTVKVRGLSVFPSLQRLNSYPLSIQGDAEMVTDVPFL